MIGNLRRTWRMIIITLWTTWVVQTARLRARFGPFDFPQGLQNWGHGAKPILGIDPRVQGTVTPPARGRLVVCNHRTPLDIVSLMCLFKGHFLANHKTRKAPVVGSAAELVGTIFVDREDKRSGANAIRQMRRLLEEKRTVIVFPEGTTHGGDEVRTFQRGAFLAAKGLDVEIVPVGLAYPEGHEFTQPSLGAHARAFLSRKVNRCWVQVGEAFDAQDAIRDEEMVRVRVQALVDQARARAKAEA
jgi:1-acyl-sn-glycerol-3-phosphate acyltransferase